MLTRHYNTKRASPKARAACLQAIRDLRTRGDVWPTLEAIARAAGVTTSTAARAVRGLEEDGRIRREYVLIGGAK